MTVVNYDFTRKQGGSDKRNNNLFTANLNFRHFFAYFPNIELKMKIILLTINILLVQSRVIWNPLNQG